MLAKVGGGRGSGSDETEARGRTANARALQVEAENRFADAQALFRSVIGRAPANLDSVHPPREALPKSVDETVSDAQATAPSVLATLADAAAAGRLSIPPGRRSIRASIWNSLATTSGVAAKSAIKRSTTARCGFRRMSTGSPSAGSHQLSAIIGMLSAMDRNQCPQSVGIRTR